MRRRSSYVPALGFHWLTPLYDPLIRNWSATARIHDAVIESLAIRPGMRLLELGAGTGRLAIELKRRHPSVQLDAIDADRSMIARARRNAARAKVHIAFREGDMTRLPASAAYDGIFSTMVFHHLSPPAKRAALVAARTALAPGGRFVVGDFGRPRGALQWLLFRSLQQTLDGSENTSPHRDGRYERTVRETFSDVHTAASWRTVAGTIEVLVCSR